MRTLAIAVSAAMLLWDCPVKAQFNTVVYNGTRYRIEAALLAVSGAEAEGIEGNEGSDAGDGVVSEIDGMPASGSVTPADADMVREEQIARYMSVSYPLSCIRVNSPYGYRNDPFSGKRKFHNGLDLYARGANVYAMMAGEVVKVGQDKASGKYVTLRHGSFTVSYCHLSGTFARQGQTVMAGETVGITGSTGRSTGEHLHITLRKDGEYFDPQFLLDYITSVRRSCILVLAAQQ